MEQKLNAMSAQGWQAVKPGRLVQQYVFDDTAAYVYRFGLSDRRSGSADDITYRSAQERAGWEICARKGKWILFRKKAADAEENEMLVDGRDPIELYYAGRIKPRETFRMWMIILATILMMAGYFTDLLPLLYAFAIPMLLALLVTMQIKYMQEGIKH